MTLYYKAQQRYQNLFEESEVRVVGKNGVKVLIVDPESGWGQHHKDDLEEFGFTVVGVAENPEEAVKLATGSIKPDVVITALDMPKPSATYEMMAAISRATGERVDFIIIDLTDQVRSMPKPLYDRDGFKRVMWRRCR